MQRVYPCGGGPVRLVSTDWLAERLRDKKFMILDCQPNVHDYIQEHIPGAVYLNENHFRCHVQNQPARFVGPEAAEPVLRSAGLKADVPVVVYTGVGAAKGWGDGLEQTMVAYSLARYGHDNVFVLDGGLDKWKAEGKPLANEYGTVEPSRFRATVREEYFIEYEEFKKIKDRADVILLDARPPEKYEGQSFWMKPGHIPGAINLPVAGSHGREEQGPSAARGRGLVHPRKTRGRRKQDHHLLLRYRAGSDQRVPALQFLPRLPEGEAPRGRLHGVGVLPG